MPSAESQVHPRALVRYGTALGMGMIALAAIWAAVIGPRSWSGWYPCPHWLADLLAGGAIGAAFALAAWELRRWLAPFRRIESLLLRTLDMAALRYGHGVLFGLLAAIPEEILFRGAIQPTLGLLPTAILFGALHALTPAYFVYASGAGLLLGGLAEWRGGLWGATAAHAVIDMLMLALLIRQWREEERARLV